MNYTIQPGDTLSAIAQRLGTTVQALAQANGISNPNMIRAGATLQVPGPTEDYRQQVRPLANGERRPNPDGTYSTEITTTVQQPDGQWVNIPTLWMAGGQPVEASPDVAQGAANQYGAATHTAPQGYPTVGAAETAAIARSQGGGNANGPLFNPVPPANPARGAIPPATPPPVLPGKAGGPVPYAGGPIRGADAAASRVQAPNLPTKVAPAQPPLPPQNIARPGVAGPPMDRGAPMTTGGGPAGYQPAGWTPVPAAGPVPTTQQWASNRPPAGSIGQGGDPAFEDIYGGGAAQPAPQALPAAAAPPQDMWQGRQGAAYDPSQRSGIQSIGRGGLPDLRSMSMNDFNRLRIQAVSNRYPPEMRQALEDEAQRRVDQLRAELTRIDQSNGMRQSRESAWQNAGEQMPRNPPAPTPSIPGNPTNPMPQGQSMPGVPLDPYGPASFQGAEARMSNGQPGNQRDPVAELIRQLRSGGGTNQVPVAALIRQLQGAA